MAANLKNYLPGLTQSSVLSLLNWLCLGRRIFKKPSRGRNSIMRICTWDAKTNEGLFNDAHWRLSWLHQLNENLMPDQAQTNKQDQMEGHPTASSSSGKDFLLDPFQSRKDHHIMTKSSSFLSPPQSICLSMNPPPSHIATHTPPPPPIPSGADKASHSTCSSQ